MTREAVIRWAEKHMAAREDPFAFWAGVYDAAFGRFDESACEAAGWADESDYCAGGREGLQRLDPGEAVGRVAHGATVGGV